jgi:hypothetical protein
MISSGCRLSASSICQFRDGGIIRSALDIYDERTVVQCPFSRDKDKITSSNPRLGGSSSFDSLRFAQPPLETHHRDLEREFFKLHGAEFQLDPVERDRELVPERRPRHRPLLLSPQATASLPSPSNPNGGARMLHSRCRQVNRVVELIRTVTGRLDG